MNPLVERKGYKIETTLSEKKKTKEKKSKPKPTEHVHIIDDDALIPWGETTTPTTTTVTTKSTKPSKTKQKQPDPADDDEFVSAEDAPVVVGKIIENNSRIIMNPLWYI